MGPRMGPWRTPVLTEYSCKDYWQKKEICILLRKEEIRPNIWPETPRDLSLCRGPAVKALAILSDTTVIRSVVDREDLKLYWKSEKRPHFSRWSTILLFTSLSKILLSTGRY